jgi:Peroxisomal biogenesis factor 11 (PEX11)
MASPADLAKTGIPSDPKPTAGTKFPTSKLAGYLPLEVRRQASQYLAKTDETLIRLQRLFLTTANVETVLAPLNYTLYLLCYVQNGLPSRSASTAIVLNDLVGSARNTLRLLQLPVLYTLLRTLLSQSSSDRGDLTIWRVNVVQCALYIIYQLLENVAHLIDLGVLASSSVPIPLYRTQATLWMHSNRFWFLGISCDLVRLAREAILARSGVESGKNEKNATSPEEEEASKKWRNELAASGFTWPLTLHWSLEHGISHVNDGVIGVFGLLASWEMLRQRWEETKSG